jgi:hypothetical protein
VTVAATAAAHKHRAERTATESPWPARIGRAGMATRGALYLVVGWLAIRVASGDTGQRADQKGALSTVARQPLGRVLVLALAAGFLAYASWRAIEAVLDPEDKGVLKRIGYAGRSILYIGFFVTALSIAFHGPQKAGSNQQQDWTAKLLGWPFGQAIVVAIGLVVIGIGIWNGYRAVSKKYRKELKSYEMSDAERPWVFRLAVAGLLGRMAAYLVSGGFLVRAAVRFDPHDGVGLDGSLHRLAAAPHGPWLLVFVAAGLILFGIYQLALARYRRVLES